MYNLGVYIDTVIFVSLKAKRRYLESRMLRSDVKFLQYLY